MGAVITPFEYLPEFNENLIFLLFSTMLIWIFTVIGKKNVITRPKGLILVWLFAIYILQLF